MILNIGRHFRHDRPLVTRYAGLSTENCCIRGVLIHDAFFSTTVIRRLDNEVEYDAARKWFSSFQQSSIPQDIGEVTYSRSSGPGGQNVNKVNSKAQLRVHLDRLFPFLPKVLHDGIKSSRYTSDKTSSLLIQCDESRKQTANKDRCYYKLNELITDIYKQTIPGETSDEQKRKVKTLKKIENETRLKLKKQHSSKKASRSRGMSD